MSKICCISGCFNEIHVPSTGTCRNCYGSILRWSKRSPEDVQRRAGTIGLYSNRMQLLIPSNVDILRPKKIKLKALPGQFRINKQKEKNALDKKSRKKVKHG